MSSSHDGNNNNNLNNSNNDNTNINIPMSPPGSSGMNRPVNRLASSLSPLPPTPSSPMGGHSSSTTGLVTSGEPMSPSALKKQFKPQEGGGSATSTQHSEATAATATTTDEAVLAYLRSKGMGHAVLELTKLLQDKKDPKESSATTTTESATLAATTTASLREQMEQEEIIDKAKRSVLAKATGGGYGFDTDSAIQVMQWGVPNVQVAEAAAAARRDSTLVVDVDMTSDDTETATTVPTTVVDVMGLDEARAYLDSFTSVQLWVLSLADDAGGASRVSIINPIQRAATLLKQNPNMTAMSLMEDIANHSHNNNKKLSSDHPISNAAATTTYNLPPSAKAELLTVSFALLVHTYCELLEVGMESTAHVLRDTFKVVYEPIYPQECKDLYHCNTTADMMRLNSHNSQYMEALNNLKTILVQVASVQLKKEEVAHQQPPGGGHHASFEVAKSTKMAEYDQMIAGLQQKYSDLSKRATLIFSKLHDLPFLRRARAVRWQLTLSATSYGLLAGYLSSQERLLAMSTLLQTKCELRVERRDPWPYTPPIVLLEDTDDTEEQRQQTVEEIAWAAPLPPQARQVEGGDVSVDPQTLPFPKFHLKKEYDNEEEAQADQQSVEFNRSLLVNGFRRLEALERKRTFDVMRRGDDPDDDVVAANPLEPSILLSTLCSTSSSGPVLTNATPRGSDAFAIWDEAGIGITSAKVCPPDGRRVAVGCDDAAVRIWVMKDAANPESVSETAQVLLGHKNGFPVFSVDWNRDGRCLLSAGGDGSVRLWDTMAVGPFGEVAKVQKRASAIATTPATPGAMDTDEGNESQPSMKVPGLRPETNEPMSGAALAVYRGHLPGTPVWSVAFAPCSYYFCSAGGDGTARLWTTDRPSPVRLFAGHTNPSVNTVEWHPNCNYILTGCEDRTARLWDVQTGRCVRLLNGCRAGISVVKVCPSGRYAAGADYSGVIHIWDLGSGKKVNELRESDASHQQQQQPQRQHQMAASNSHNINNSNMVSKMIHTLSYSSCGSVLASGGDDCCVRIWDVRGAANHMGNPDYAARQGWGQGAKPSAWDGAAAAVKEPHKTFATRRTLILDLHFTRRNLLLSVGKYVSAASPVATPISE